MIDSATLIVGDADAQAQIGRCVARESVGEQTVWHHDVLRRRQHHVAVVAFGRGTRNPVRSADALRDEGDDDDGVAAWLRDVLHDHAGDGSTSAEASFSSPARKARALLMGTSSSAASGSLFFPTFVLTP
jgi:hypothetical protein